MGIVKVGLSLLVCASHVLMVVNSLSYPSESKSEQEHYLFVLGDSLYDPGNNAIIDPKYPSNSCPYGFNYYKKPTGRLSDGQIVPDFVASNMNISIPPVMEKDADFTYGANFASAGSGVFDDHRDSINLSDQYKNFTNVADMWRKELGEEEARQRLNQAIYLISMGGNDYFPYSTNNKNASIRQMQPYVDSVIGNFSNVLKNMYDQGARKFMLQNVSPIGCISVMQSQFGITDGCAQIPLTLAALHNAALYPMAESIKNTTGYSDFTYSIFDFYTLLGRKIRDPNLRGDKPCYKQEPNKPAVLPIGYECTDANGRNFMFNGSVCGVDEVPSYVFFDDGHNTNDLNHNMSEILWNGDEEDDEVVYPYTMKALLEHVIIASTDSHLKMNI